MIVKKLSDKKIKVIDKVPITMFPSFIKIDEIEINPIYKFVFGENLFIFTNRSYDILKNKISQEFGIKKKYIQFGWSNISPALSISINEYQINNRIINIHFTDYDWYKKWLADNREKKINTILKK
jgi:hypothetical protein